ncbi:aldose epimerase family protein [Aureliella helgolandensis]|uniref:Aldose 1-epimerase n=1 Tax=Aureliella helgolandensis TaxID=2527968 RepID=A0A518GHM6_9BACT|nr:aldose epimerase family protein [Aureliella helgolandensis]QDV28099.1 Aldose 1-epimerase precursor [Aureliella helgolandensis]
MAVARTSFGSTPDGTAVELFTLTNSRGNIIKLTNYGAILVSVEVPDRCGQLQNVNLGYSTLAGYLERHPYLGSTVGRFCNRIASGRFSLDGQEYSLAVNNGPNHLHGGLEGFDRMVWGAEVIEASDRSSVRLTHVSTDGDEGYPGTLTVTVEYTWSDADELSFAFRATTDRSTVLNLTNHSYWNLAGAGTGDVLAHVLQLNCEKYLDVDETLIPTGQILPVAESVLDFRSPRALGERIAQLPDTKGYDHCFVVDGAPGTMRSVGNAVDPASGRMMEVLTTQPGVQLYTGNHLDGVHEPHGGFCLETQHYPDSPNQPHFPTTRLDPGMVFEQTTIHRFSTKSE